MAIKLAKIEVTSSFNESGRNNLPNESCQYWGLICKTERSVNETLAGTLGEFLLSGIVTEVDRDGHKCTG